MNTVEKIFSLLNNSQKSENYIEKQIGLAQGSFKNWRNEKSKPSAEALHKIADYFDVSTDYLLGRTENKSTTTTDGSKSLNDIHELIMNLKWEDLTPAQQNAMARLVYGAEVERLDKEKDKKK